MGAWMTEPVNGEGFALVTAGRDRLLVTVARGSAWGSRRGAGEPLAGATGPRSAPSSGRPKPGAADDRARGPRGWTRAAGRHPSPGKARWR
jgi:hypothetical protein